MKMTLKELEDLGRREYIAQEALESAEKSVQILAKKTKDPKITKIFQTLVDLQNQLSQAMVPYNEQRSDLESEVEYELLAQQVEESED
jgi:hypothetical protein